MCAGVSCRWALQLSNRKLFYVHKDESLSSNTGANMSHSQNLISFWDNWEIHSLVFTFCRLLQDVSPTNLVLQAMPATFQMHLLCVWIIETTFTQLAVEADDFAFIVPDLERSSTYYTQDLNAFLSPVPRSVKTYFLDVVVPDRLDVTLQCSQRWSGQRIWNFSFRVLRAWGGRYSLRGLHFGLCSGLVHLHRGL